MSVEQRATLFTRQTQQLAHLPYTLQEITMSEKTKIATVWLDGCSGCHMSFLDIDERIIELAELADLVYSPLVDNKEFPPDVVVTIVEGAVSSEEDLEKIKMIRGRTQLLVSLGDCAVTANVPGMRNEFKTGRCARTALIWKTRM